MAKKVNPVGATVLPNGSGMAARIQPLFKAKPASVIPPPRKLVKRRIFDLLVKFVASLCSSGGTWKSNNNTMTNTYNCDDPFLIFCNSLYQHGRVGFDNILNWSLYFSVGFSPYLNSTVFNLLVKDHAFSFLQFVLLDNYKIKMNQLI